MLFAKVVAGSVVQYSTVLLVMNDSGVYYDALQAMIHTALNSNSNKDKLGPLESVENNPSKTWTLMHSIVPVSS